MSQERIPFTRIHVDSDTHERVSDVLESQQYVKGPVVRGFEQQFAALCDCEHAVAVASGSVAIWLALKALDVGPDDTVFVPGHTFFGTASPVFEVDATPAFVDVDPVTYTMDPEALARAADAAENPAAVLPVHIYGQPTDMDAIQAVADDYDMAVVEDAAQSHGATWGGAPVGPLGDIGCFSFYPTKNMTVCGEGGMVVTDDAELARRVRSMSDHGRTPDGVHAEVGLNLRMDELRAAIGSQQVDHLPTWNERRRARADHYHERLADLDDVVRPMAAAGGDHVYHVYAIQSAARDDLAARLDDSGVTTDVDYPVPAHRHPAVEARVDVPDLPVSERLADRTLSLPMHPQLSHDAIDRVCDEIHAFYGV